MIHKHTLSLHFKPPLPPQTKKEKGKKLSATNIKHPTSVHLHAFQRGAFALKDVRKLELPKLDHVWDVSSTSREWVVVMGGWVDTTLHLINGWL